MFERFFFRSAKTPILTLEAMSIVRREVCFVHDGKLMVGCFLVIVVESGTEGPSIKYFRMKSDVEGILRQCAR